MRQPQEWFITPLGVGIASVVQHFRVVIHPVAIGCVEVNHMNLAARYLKEPDRRVVAVTNVPSGINRNSRVIRHISDLLLRQVFAVVSACNGCFKATFKLLRKLVVRHAPFRIHQFSIFNQAAGAGLQHHGEPRCLCQRVLVRVVKLVMPLGCADEHSPSFAVCQHGSNDFTPHAGAHIGKFVQDHAVKVQPPQPVRVVCAIEPYPRTVWQISPQL